MSPIPVPSGSVLVALGSIAVHAEEMVEPGGHDFDRQALLGLLANPDLKEWLASMDALALLPVKRS